MDADLDTTLWFRGSCGEIDFLLAGNPHTHPGRMAAYCPHQPEHAGYNVSISDLADCSDEARWWAHGFVVGSEPAPPIDDAGDEVEEDDPAYTAWAEHRASYRETGVWRPDIPRGQ